VGLNYRFHQKWAALQAVDQPDQKGLLHNFDLGSNLYLELDRDLNRQQPLREFFFGFVWRQFFSTAAAWTGSGFVEQDIGTKVVSLGLSQYIAPLRGQLVGVIDWQVRYRTEIHWGFRYCYKNRAYISGGVFPSGYAWGVGLTYKFLNINYAFVSESLGLTPYVISLGVAF
jgi:hypothetical protein